MRRNLNMARKYFAHLPTRSSLTRSEGYLALRIDDFKFKESLTPQAVLVADDEEPTRKLIVALLSRQGHQCITACNGLETLEEVEKEKIDVVVTDIVIPEMGGIALLKQLSKKRHDLPIMVLTGRSSRYPEVAFLEAGVENS